MNTVISKDGTSIGYTHIGSGPPVVLVDGAFCSRSFGPMPKLAPLLAHDFSVYFYDRRGRGESGDTRPYAVEREIDDLRALVDAAGDAVHVYGTSSGAVLAMRAAAHGLPLKKLAVYEPPLVLAGSPQPLPPDLSGEIDKEVAANKRGDAVKSFMRMVGVPSIAITLMRFMPGVWPKLTAVAHTLPYDFAIMGDTRTGKPLPPELAQTMAAIEAPTLAMVGGKSPAWMSNTVRIVASGIPGATLKTLSGQQHDVDPRVMAPALREFFAA